MNKICFLLLFSMNILATNTKDFNGKNNMFINGYFSLIDLTHTLSSDVPTWLGDCGFRKNLVLDYDQCESEFKFRVHTFAMNASAGTHIDAPAHCIKGAESIEQLGLENLLVPVVVIDVSSKANATYMITVDDIAEFEQTYGEIKPGALVIVRTGWEKFWTTPEKYRNNHIYPSVSPEVAQLFVIRNCVGLGIDTLSADCPHNGFNVHTIMLGAGKYLIENVAHLEKLPPFGAYAIVAPLKIEGATESPIRLFGLIKN